MKGLVLVGVLLLGAAQARAGDRLLFYSLGAADALSTEHALKVTGAYEKNPLLQKRAIRVASQVAYAEGSTQLVKALRPGHRRLAKGLKLLSVGVKLGLILNNEKLALHISF